MSFFTIGMALLLIFCAGFGVSILLASARRPLWVVELFALSWLLGTAFISTSQFAFGLVISSDALQSFLALLCIGSALLGARRIRGRVAGFSFPKEWADRLLLLVVAAQVAFLFWLASRQCFGWDGLAVWEFKARAAFLNGGIPTRAYYTDPTIDWTHPNYPLFLPMLESWVYLWIGNCDQSSIRIFGPLFYLSGIALLGSGAARFSGKVRIGFISAALPFFLPWIVQRGGGVLSGYVDFPLGVFYLASVLYLVAFLRDKTTSDLRFFMATSAVMPWIKTEGSILWLCVAVLALLMTFSHLRLRALLLVVPGAGMIALWALFQKIMQVPRQPVFLPVTFATLLVNADRSFPLARETLLELGNLKHWSILWAGVAFALLWLVSFGRTRSSFVIVCALVVPLMVFPSIYLFTSGTGYLEHLWQSFPRLVLQLAPTGVLAIALALSEERGAPATVTLEFDQASARRCKL